MVSKRFLNTPLLLLASGCAFTGPITDRSFEDAPYAACADFTAAAPAASVGQDAVAVGCFNAFARTMSNYGSASASDHVFTPEGLAVGGNAAFANKGGDGCDGKFTNLVDEYSTPQGGSATLAATDALGRVLGTETIRGDASAKIRRAVIREMGDPLKFPAILEISDVQGPIVVRSVCLKGY